MERSMAELTALTKAGLSAFRSVVSSAEWSVAAMAVPLVANSATMLVACLVARLDWTMAAQWERWLVASMVAPKVAEREQMWVVQTAGSMVVSMAERLEHLSADMTAVNWVVHLARR